MMASLRATTIRALRPPLRLARRMSQAFNGENRCAPVSNTPAASYGHVRRKLAPRLETRPCRSVSPDW
jgi:hypothetical protein